MKKLIINLILLLIFISLSFAQGYDNLKQKFADVFDCKQDTCIINQLNKLYKDLSSTDADSAAKIAYTALSYAKLANYESGLMKAYYNVGDIQLYNAEFVYAKAYLDSSLVIAEKLKDQFHICNIYNLTGIMWSDQGFYEKSLEFYDKQLELAKKINNEKGIALAWSNIGVTHYMTADYGKAIECFLKGLEIHEKNKDSVKISISLSNIATFYQIKGQYDLSVSSLFNSIEYLDKDNLLERAAAYNNIAVNYDKMDSLGLALDYAEKSKALRQKMGDYRNIASSFYNIGGIYIKLKKFKEAKENIQLAIDMALEKDYKSDAANYLRGMSVNCFENGEYETALKYGLKSQEIAKELELRDIECDNYHLLADILKHLKRFEEATDYMFKYQVLNDSLLEMEFAANIADMEAKYDNQKKQREIESLQTDKVLQDLEIKKSNLQRNGFIVGFGLVLVLVIVVGWSLVQKRKANRLLAEQNEAIRQQKEEITAQRDEIESQRDMLQESNTAILMQKEEIEAQRDEIIGQRDRIEHINRELTDSIKYARRIQSAILPTRDFASELLPDHFVLYKPKDIVSGDFYWMTKIEGAVVVAAADCTGHGVPGAFMSMLGAAFLNEIVSKGYITHPGVILRKLRKEIIRALQQKGESMEAKDGMDIALCSINLETLELQFSGANNPLYIIPIDPPIDGSERELIELKPDKMPIAIYERMDNFVCHEHKLKNGDQLYMFSDGFPDQFGGAKGKKFKYKPFKEILLANSHRPMEKQKEELENAFNQWIGYIDPVSGLPFEQVDDVVVIGLRV